MPRSGPRRGEIKAELYFPKKGDRLDDLVEGMTYECVRTDLYLDKVSGERIRYGLLIGRHPDWGQDPIPASCLEIEKDRWLGAEGERTISQIRRKRDSGEERAYVYDPDIDAYVFDPEQD